MPTNNQIYFIHVGKTGGTAVKKVARKYYNVKRSKAPQTVTGSLVLHNHISLSEAERRFGPAGKIAFTFRDPTERFTSGFYCRLRMGHPQHTSRWDASEAAAFSHFEDANDLAECLSSQHHAKRSAAFFAMDAIRHLRRGYAFHFGDRVNFILDQAPRVAACIDTKNLTRNGSAFMQRLGFENLDENTFLSSANSTTHSKHLSELALKNLREYWSDEYAYYDTFKAIEAELSGY